MAVASGQWPDIEEVFYQSVHVIQVELEQINYEKVLATVSVLTNSMMLQWAGLLASIYIIAESNNDQTNKRTHLNKENYFTESVETKN